MRHLEIFYPGLRYVDTTYWRGHPITTNLWVWIPFMRGALDTTLGSL